jgi:hypothetical protein
LSRTLIFVSPSCGETLQECETVVSKKFGCINNEVFFMQKHPKKKLQVISAEYERVLQQFIDDVLELRRKEYHSALEPFDAYANKVRQDLTNHFHEFYHNFLNGYDVLVDQIRKKS